mmetsp:Transcript_15687/g.19906  ORF Transcript_15687/g.19906 Transcript_15687/m.19906 type:complete len:118 (-) Transcript_15687:309-662(-)
MSFKILQLEQNKKVARKLYITTGIMFTVPFLAYFLSYHFIFHNKVYPESWSGGVAVFAANIVLYGYVYSAFTEEDDEEEDDNNGNPDEDGGARRLRKKKGDNDEFGPRVGTFKQRTD